MPKKVHLEVIFDKNRNLTVKKGSYSRTVNQHDNTIGDDSWMDDENPVPPGIW